MCATQVSSLNSEEAAEVLWRNPNTATQFLVCAGLLILPRLCPRGHPWKLIACGARCGTLLGYYDDLESEDEEGNPKEKRDFCRASSTWRVPKSLLQAMPSRKFTPEKLTKLLFWFSEGESLKRVKTEARVSEKTLALVVNAVRRIMRWDLLQDVGQRKLGGWGKIVVIDETYWKKPKTTRGGFRGRPSGAEKICVLGLCEVDMETRTCTGNIRLIEISGPTKACIREQILLYVEPGSLIFTDSHKSYRWLTEAGFVHRAVNHRRREFSRTELIYGHEIVVSTNSAEGLFGRVKEFARAKQRKKSPGGAMD